MNRFILTSLMCACILSFSSFSSALEISKTEDMDHHKMMHKGKRGLINVLTSPAEIPKQIKAEYNADGEKTGTKTMSVLGGTVKGLAYMGGRIGSGLWDIVTLNLAVPENYEPLMKPEYICEKKSK